MKIKLLFILQVFLCLLSSVNAQNDVSLQSLLREMVDRKQITKIPQEKGYRTLQASSYNRASISPDEPGWFADSDGVFCIRTEKNKKGETEWVLMEDFGPGAITKIWAVCFYYSLRNTKGANIKIYLDGNDIPAIHCNFFDFVRGKLFVQPPLAAETRRAGNSYLPIPYAKSCKVTMDQKVFYNIINYRSYPEGTNIKTFSLKDLQESKSLVDSVNRILTTGVYTDKIGLDKDCCHNGQYNLKPGTRKKMKIRGKGKAIEQLKFKLNAKDINQALRSTILKISFDGEQTVWTPIGDFFNIGVGIKPYQMWERSVQEDGTMICRWIMPFKRSAQIELENLGEQSVEVAVKAETMSYEWTNRAMYFHSTWRMDNPTPTFPLFDYNLVKVKGKGVYVGDQFTVLNPKTGWWGEGDEKVYVDDDKFPSHFGTGTEDYYGWAGGVVPDRIDEFYKPFLSNVRVASPQSKGYNTCTRTRVLDAIPFNEYLNFNIESSAGTRTSWFHLQYAVNTYWYALPGAECNRKPMPEMASRKITPLEELEEYNESCRSKQYVFPDAVEAENLGTYKIDQDIVLIKSMNLWGEISNGKAKYFQFNKPDKYAEVLLTEIFKNVSVKVCLLLGNRCGKFDIYVNDKYIKNVNLQAEHAAVATIDLGLQEPVNNALKIRFVSKKAGQLGVDYFIIK